MICILEKQKTLYWHKEINSQDVYFCKLFWDQNEFFMEVQIRDSQNSFIWITNKNVRLRRGEIYSNYEKKPFCISHRQI